MKYVLDSSVAFKWLVPELNTDKALRLLGELMVRSRVRLAARAAVAHRDTLLTEIRYD